MSAQNPDEFVRRYQPQGPSLLHCLTATSDEMEARLAPLWELSQRATLSRLPDEQRRKMKTSVTPQKRARGLEYANLFLRRDDLSHAGGLHGQVFLDLLNKDVVLDQCLEATGRVARAARDGRMLLNATLSALNARVILKIEEKLRDPGTPRARREQLQSYLAAIYRDDSEQRGRDEAARRRAEGRLAGLRAQLKEVRENAAVRTFLDELLADQERE